VFAVTNYKKEKKDMSKKLWYSILAMFVIAATVLAACAPAATPTEEATGTELAVGIVLPTRDEPRWIQDETRFRDALTAAGYEAEILFSQGDSAREKANVESLISQGIKVLIITPHDGTAAGARRSSSRGWRKGHFV
jgi:putative multiple sugar transport system substrate-binding protein